MAVAGEYFYYRGRQGRELASLRNRVMLDFGTSLLQRDAFNFEPIYLLLFFILKTSLKKLTIQFSMMQEKTVGIQLYQRLFELYLRHY